MLPLDQYLAKQMRKAKINEFDLMQKDRNIRACVDFVMDYFMVYLSDVEAQKGLRNQRLERYQKYIREYPKDVQRWFISVYSEHGKMMERILRNDTAYDEFFYLYNSEKEFETFTAESYSRLIIKYPFIKDCQPYIMSFFKQIIHIGLDIDICPEVNRWAKDTWNKYNVGVLAFAFDYIECFAKRHYREHRNYDYDYKRQQNLFTLDDLFERIPQKPFIIRRKKEFEILMMYFWLHDIVGDDDHYWPIYLHEAQKALQNPAE